MFTYINIKNFAVIKDIELDLQSELTCLTGETGAGKSIIIDSLELALGSRIDASLLKNNSEPCEITVMFDLTNLENARELLVQQELDSDNECIIRRTISNDGRSKCSVNGSYCTQQILRTLGEMLLNIHGQHENQGLLRYEHQRELLDAFADSQHLSKEVKKLYGDWLEAQRKVLDLEGLTENQHDKIDFLKHQLNELKNLNLGIEDINNLRVEQKRLSNIEEFSSNINSALDILSEDNSKSIIDGLYNVKNKLETCKKIDGKIAMIVEMIDSAIIQSEEAISSLRQHSGAIDFSVEHKEETEEQLSHIYTIARKHQVQAEELEEIKLKLNQQLDVIQNAALQLENAKLEVKKIGDRYLKVANNLSSKRKFAATALNKLVTSKMHLLGMKEGKFMIDLTPNPNGSFSAVGLEKLEFLVSTNPGHPMQALNKIASGGELSRISLAIQAITSEKKTIPTLIFDEIDAGIGGRIADVAGKLLRNLAKKTQIICITHLPQIAAQAHQHIFIEKKVKSKTTEVDLVTLNKNERVKEIARMLGGEQITKQTIAHAEEMLSYTK